jgi:hypothetical protein
VADVDASLTAAKQQLSAAKREYDTQLGQQVQLHRCGPCVGQEWGLACWLLPP